MVNWLKKHKLNISIFFILLAGLLIRTYFVNKVVVGDLLNYVEWGHRFAESGGKNFYFSEGWYYSVPVYPPVSILTFAAMDVLNQHRYVLAQLHNIIKFPPAVFIVYFYEWGSIFLTKLPGMLCDLGLSLLIYKLIFKLTKNIKKSLAGLLFFLLNPLTIFISGAWGQTDSVVGLLGLLSFLALLDGNVILSMPLLFLSIYFKPSWLIFGPFYLYIVYLTKPKVSQFIIGSILTVMLFVATTAPFSNGNVFTYGWKLFKERYPIPVGIDGKASISAFNFQTIFFKIDIDYSHQKLLGITSGNLGLFSFLLVYVYALVNFAKQKNRLTGMLAGLFTIGMGSFMFMPTMLERYFYPAFAPLIILSFSKPKILLGLILANIILIANTTYSFYRRGSDEIGRPFVNNNFALIRILSVFQVINYIYLNKHIYKSQTS